MKRPELTSDDAYVTGVLPFLAKRGLPGADPGTVRAALPLIRPRAQTFVEAADALDYFFREPRAADEKAVKKFLVPDKAARLADLRAVIADAPDLHAKELEAWVATW